MSDNKGKRLPFVQIGYSLCAISKPMLAAFVYPLWIFFARTIDRLGKGIRTGARDALLSDEATPETKGRVFGFHRSMDTLGAVLGPFAALIFLAYYPEKYKLLFVIAFLPGLLALSLTFLIKEKRIHSTNQAVSKTRFFDFIKYWKESPVLYRKFVGALLAFALINSSDVFLLLKIKEAGYKDTIVIATYIFYNIVYSIFSYPMGILADKIGMKKVFILGLIVFTFVYGGMAFAASKMSFALLFFLYGIYAAATEGIAKAWISNISERKDVATAIGTYTAFQSIATLLASSITGFIWMEFGARTAFLLSAGITILVVLFISVIKER
jgi:MFS family permease